MLKVDFDDYDDIAGDYYIGSLPTVILLDHGKGIKSTINPNLSNFFCVLELDRFMGAKNEIEIENFLSKHASK